MKNNEENYIKLINRFWSISQHMDSYKSDYGILFFSILDFINKNGWKDMEIDYDRIIYRSKLGKRTYLEGRKWLKENEFISLIEGRGDYQKAKFGVVYEVQKCTAQSTATDTAQSTADAPQQIPHTAPIYNKTFKPLNLKTNKLLKEKEKEEIEFSKNENYALLSENEFIKSELEKAKELIKTLEEKTKKQKKEVTPKIEKIAFGEFQNVLLTSDQEQKLLEKHGKFKFECIIEKLSNAKEKNNKLKYDSDYAAIGSWVARSVEEDSDKKRNSQTNSLNGTTSQISNSRHKSNWNAEEVARDAIAIATAHIR